MRDMETNILKVNVVFRKKSHKVNNTPQLLVNELLLLFIIM